MEAACIEGEYNAGYGMQIQSEDSLFLNVVAPVDARLLLSVARFILFKRISQLI